MHGRAARTMIATRLAQLLFLVCVADLALAPARAETYPARPIRVIVSTSAGGVTDLCARILGGFITARTGQPVVVDNKSGAGGNLAMDMVAKAAPDGYTLGVANTGNIVINPYLYSHMPYDPLADLAPVGSLGRVPLFLVVNGKVPAHTLQEFVAYAKAAPGKLSYASAGTGTTPHLAADEFIRRAGLNIVHVPYRGSAPGVMDVIAGNIAMTFISTGPHMAFVRRGDLRVLAVAADRRLPYLPDVPTFAEQGFPDFAVSTWFAVFAPRATPPEIVAQLNGYVRGLVADSDSRQRLEGNFVDPTPLTTAQFADEVKSDAAKWERIVRASGAKVD
jgi:tripartite-type tricarboxylate transporter receptor subunit TctC